jgi:hypothetical protein
MNTYTPEQISSEIARRECIPNEFTGVTPVLVRVNGKYKKVIPKLLPLFTIAPLLDYQKTMKISPMDTTFSLLMAVEVVVSLNLYLICLQN